MVAEGEEEGVGGCLVQGVGADVVVGVGGVVDGEDVGEGLGGVGGEFVGHVYCRWRETIS